MSQIERLRAAAVRNYYLVAATKAPRSRDNRSCVRSPHADMKDVVLASSRKQSSRASTATLACIRLQKQDFGVTVLARMKPARRRGTVHVLSRKRRPRAATVSPACQDGVAAVAVTKAPRRLGNISTWSRTRGLRAGVVSPAHSRCGRGNQAPARALQYAATYARENEASAWAWRARNSYRRAYEAGAKAWHGTRTLAETKAPRDHRQPGYVEKIKASRGRGESERSTDCLCRRDEATARAL